MKYLSVVMLFVVALTITGNAQDVITTTAPVASSKALTELFAASSTKVVKGAPFSAEGVSESIQILPDGNKITRSTTSKMYRDSEGRFRREGSSNAGGMGSVATSVGLLPAYGFQFTTSIYDPVEGIRYTLNPTLKTFHRFTNQNLPNNGATIVYGQATSDLAKIQVELEKSNVRKIETQAAQKSSVYVTGNAVSYDSKKEQLGTKTFEGVEAEGTRTVTTIPANSIGNERPIEIVYERWFSKELDLIVYSRNYDPRFGEQIYRLTNISRSEPDRSLFTVPSDYKPAAEIAPSRIYTPKLQ